MKLVALLILLFGLAVAGYGTSEIFLRRPLTDATPVGIVIRPGSGVHAISKSLKENDIISNRFIFETYVWITKTQSRFQTGSFNLLSGASYASIVRDLTRSVTAERTITILEGWGIREIGEYLEREGVLRAEELKRVTGTPAVDYRRDEKANRPFDVAAEFPLVGGKPDYVSLEGYLFPDTYRIKRDEAPEEVVRTMLRTLELRIDESLRQEIEASGHTVFEILTIASIIEREVQSNADRYLISDVLWRRLEAGIALQVDSSVNYVTGKKTPSISFVDRDIDSPYNTYQYPGLPLGPIGNPGRASILAAIRPKANQYWYFLAGTDGVIHYGRTLEEHGENRARYLR